MGKDLNAIVSQVDVRGRRKFSFEMLGTFMQKLGVYKILYNEKHKAHNKPTLGEIKCDDTCCHSREFLMRQYRENEFHYNLWRKLNITGSEYISTELLKELLVLLYEANYMSMAVLAERIEGMS